MTGIVALIKPCSCIYAGHFFHNSSLCYPPRLEKAVAVPVGTLRREPVSRQYIFSYDREYLDKGRAFGPIDPLNLPLSDKPYRLGKSLRGVFADAAPDWWGRQIISRLRASNELNELDYLAEPDGARLGCLDFGAALPDIPDLSALPEYLALARHIENKATMSPKEMEFFRRMYHGASIGGSRPKFSIQIDGELWIAKLPSIHDAWSNARVELFSMRLADACGIDVPEMRLASGDILLVKRFDRFNGMRRLGYLSARTLLTLDNNQGGSYVELASVMRKLGMGDSRKQLFRRMAFNAIIRNLDDHPQNHGFLYDGQKMALSPAFDILPIPWALQMDKRANLAMTAGKFGSRTDRENILSEGRAFGLAEVEAAEIFNEIIDAVASRWEKLIEECGVNPHDQALLKPIVDHWKNNGRKP